MATLKSKMGNVVLRLFPFNRRVFNLLRYEFWSLWLRVVNSVNPFYHSAVRRIVAQSAISINVGSGGRGLPGWTNIELIRMRDTTLCLDIRRQLPLANGSVARLFAEHVVEHLDFRHDIPAVFKDWHRVMQPGAALRIVVPDACRFLQAYVSGENSAWTSLGWNIDNLPGDISTPMEIINHIFHQGGEHLFGYDFETLALALRNAGFRKIAQMSFRQSCDPQLAIDQENHSLYSLYVEAVK